MKERRINVAITPAMDAALRNVMDNDQTTQKNALERLVKIGAFIYDAVQRPGSKIMIDDREITFM